MPTVVCADGGEVLVGHDFVEFLGLIPDGMIDQQDAAVVPLCEVTKPVLLKVLDWHEDHKGAIVAPADDTPNSSETQLERFFDKLSGTDFFNLIHASNYLGLDTLLAASCKAVALALLRSQKSPDVNSNAIQDYDQLTTMAEEKGVDLDTCTLDKAALRVFMTPELRQKVSLEKSKEMNRSLKQKWDGMQGSYRWRKLEAQGSIPSISDVRNLPKILSLDRDFQEKACIDDENAWLEIMLSRLRLGIRKQERATNRNKG